MSHLRDTNAPPPDLDVLAARSAEQRYRILVERGVSKVQAWQEAVSVFAGHHPSWPMPLAEREAARTVGALILNRQAAASDRPKSSANKIPLDLLVDLTTPETAESMRATARVAEMGLGAVSIFRGAWKLAGNVRPVTSRGLLARPSAASAAPGDEAVLTRVV
ncbi:hypothetical protein [Roseomonas populi]|uniref:Uncharacterized protein n=1 Tax=Roseomonas populi TaxID=3121582 RepID=A0ABT1XBB4_9PROT|nr:hypothetical protein [Roseomonas pecuniae]MCR0985420.1 hypothetical protein [Roseomonas pecuniae]